MYICFDWFREKVEKRELDVARFFYLAYFCEVSLTFLILRSKPHVPLLSKTSIALGRYRPPMRHFVEAVARRLPIELIQPVNCLAEPPRVDSCYDLAFLNGGAKILSQYESVEWQYFMEVVALDLYSSPSATFLSLFKQLEELRRACGNERELQKQVELVYDVTLTILFSRLSPRMQLAVVLYRLADSLEMTSQHYALQKLQQCFIGYSPSFVPDVIRSSREFQDATKDYFNSTDIRHKIKPRCISSNYLWEKGVCFYLVSTLDVLPVLQSPATLDAMGFFISHYLMNKRVSLRSRRLVFKGLFDYGDLNDPYPIALPVISQMRQLVLSKVMATLMYEYWEGWLVATREFNLWESIKLSFYQILWVAQDAARHKENPVRAAYAAFREILRDIILKAAPFELGALGGTSYSYGKDEYILTKKCSMALKSFEGQWAFDHKVWREVKESFTYKTASQGLFGGRYKSTQRFYDAIIEFMEALEAAIFCKAAQKDDKTQLAP